MHGYNSEKSVIRHSQSQRTKGKGKKDSPSPGGRGPSPGLLCLVSSLPLGRPCHCQSEVDKSQRPQGHHPDHVPNRGTRKTATVASSQVFTADTGGRGTEVHVSPEVPTPTEAPGAQPPSQRNSQLLPTLPSLPPASLLCLRK